MMLEKLGADAIAKLGEQIAAKGGEGQIQNELARETAQREAFRLGEMSAAELKDVKGIKERESLAADELRSLMTDEFSNIDATTNVTDGSAEIVERDGQNRIEAGNIEENSEAQKATTDQGEHPQDVTSENEKPQIVQNKEDGCRREEEVMEELGEKYPADEGYKILRERDIVDEKGVPVKDPAPGDGKQPEGRRIDIVVVDKDGKVVECVEVTSPTAPKDEQMAKEQRIRDNGGNYIRDPDTGTLHDISNTPTRIERRP